MRRSSILPGSGSDDDSEPDGLAVRNFSIMQEDLLGYLLGALEPHEMRRIERYIQDHPEARDELDRLAKKMRPLEETEAAIHPPRDLMARTLETIRDAAALQDTPERSAVDAAIGVQSPQEVPQTTLLSDSVEAPRGRRSGPINWAVGAMAAAIVCAMVVPSMLQMREDARRTACQDQLRQLGTSLTQYVNRDPQNRLPEIAREGSEAFAGMYAIRLSDSGLMPNPMLRWCPSVSVPESDSTDSMPVEHLASLSDVRESKVNRLQEIQRSSGGNYAYNLGVVDNSRYQSPRYESRATFAVLADLPLNPVSVGGGYEASTAHDKGINVLYEDGSIQFISTTALDAIPDNPLQNHHGKREAGVNVDDASLAPSWLPPFVDVRQR